MKVKAVKYFIVTVSVLLALTVCGEPAHASGFADVPGGTRMADAAEFLSHHNIVQGYGDRSFRPNNPVSRAEFAVILCNLTGARDAKAASSAFSDVRDHWAKSYVAAVTERGYMNGYEDGSFRPDGKLTYEQAVAVMMRLLYPEKDFSSNAVWYRKYVDEAVSDGFTQGMRTKAGQELPRGDMAVLIYNVCTYFSGEFLSFSYETQSTGYACRDLSESNGGAYSFCIDLESLGNHHLRQTVSVEPNASYVISADIKTRDVAVSHAGSRTEGAYVSVQIDDGDNVWDVSSCLSGTNDWTTVKVLGFSDREGNLPFDLNLGGSGDQASSGTVWFDNVTYTRTTDCMDSDPTWKFLAVILPNTRLDTGAGAKKPLHLSYTMKDRHIDLLKDALAKLESDLTEISRGKIGAQIDVIVSDAVMDAYENEDFGYTISEESAYIYCAENGIDISRYDHIYFISCLPGMPADYFGLGGSFISGYTGFSQIYFLSEEYLSQTMGEGWYWTSSVFIHEFLHSMETYSEALGYEAAVLHDGEKYKYKEEPNDWREFYTDFINQEISYQGKKIGIDRRVFAIKPHDFQSRPAGRG